PAGTPLGLSCLLRQLAPSQLGSLREPPPAAGRFGLLVNPTNENAETISSEDQRRDQLRSGEQPPRDRGGVRGAGPRQGGRVGHRNRPVFLQPAGPTYHAGDAPCFTRGL